jgi:hypothetical protein
MGNSRIVETDVTNRWAVIFVDNTELWWGLRLTATTQGDHARNMHCWLPGFWDETTHAVKPQHLDDPWHPEFIRSIEGFNTLRFMGYLNVNGADNVRTWADVKPGSWWNQGVSDHGYGGHVSPLWCIKLANRIHANAWINIWHMADDDLVRRFAELVRDNLSPDLDVIVEYSNECWNWAFPFSIQAGYCKVKGGETGLPGNGPAEYYTYRSLQVWQIFDEVFGEQKGRVKKVLAWQIGTDFNWHFGIINSTRWNPNGQKPTFCAVAPYIHNNNNGIPTSLSPEEFIDQAQRRFIPEERNSIRTSKAAAQAQGYPLGAYEANQHWFSDNPTTQAYYLSCKRHPAMKQFQLAYIAMLAEELNGPISLFGSSGYGTWGAREYYNQPRSEAPVWDAWLTHIEKHLAHGRRLPGPEVRRTGAQQPQP